MYSYHYIIWARK